MEVALDLANISKIFLNINNMWQLKAPNSTKRSKLSLKLNRYKNGDITPTTFCTIKNGAFFPNCPCNCMYNIL